MLDLAAQVLLQLISSISNTLRHTATHCNTRTMLGLAAGFLFQVISIILIYCARHPWGNLSAVGNGSRSP